MIKNENVNEGFGASLGSFTFLECGHLEIRSFERGSNWRESWRKRRAKFRFQVDE